MKLLFTLPAGLLAGVGLLVQPWTLLARPGLFTNHVLELDGTNSFVELPAGAFTNLDEVTVEGWVKWDSLQPYSRFFDFTFAGYELNVQNRFDTSMLRVESLHGDDLRALDVPDYLPLSGWVHIAVTADLKGFSVFVNGRFLGTNAPPYQFSSTGLGKRNYLGRSNFKAVYTTDADFKGQMAEVRVWKGCRTAEQIRANMFAQLSGSEEGLQGLWNFADGTDKDATPAAHHGKLAGLARVGEAALPAPATLVPWSRLLLEVTDAAGAAVRNPSVRAEVNGTELGRATGNFQGWTPLTVWTAARAVDLVASASNDLGGWRFAVPITPYVEQTNAWKLGPAIHLAGRAVALDGKTPHANLVLELVQPEESSVGTPIARPSVALSPSDGQSDGVRGGSQNRQVLQLDGNSYLELPSGIFKPLTQATIEGWIKWDRLGPAVDFAAFGTYGTTIYIATGGRPIGGVPTDLFAGIMPGPNEDHWVHLPNLVRTNEWYHLALVLGSGGLRLFVNGVLAATNAYSGSFSSLEKINDNRLGANISDGPSLTGQLAEFRVWKVQRTAEQIRGAMFQRLGESEPDLFGVWNFDTPAQIGRDATSGAHHARPVGNPTLASSVLPKLVFGSITDAAGKPVANATVTVSQPGLPARQVSANDAGEYAFTLALAAPCDLFVTTGTLSAYRLDFQPTGERQQRLDWTLADPVTTPVILGNARGPRIQSGSEPGALGPQFPSGPHGRHDAYGRPGQIRLFKCEAGPLPGAGANPRRAGVAGRRSDS